MKPKSLASRLFDGNSESGATLNARAAKYQRHVDPRESPYPSGHSDSQSGGDNNGPNERSHRQVHFAFLPERYEPLVDEEARVTAKEERKKRRKEKYKKVKKCICGMKFLDCSNFYLLVVSIWNAGKALRCTWKCLMLGLYNFALGYSTPITVASAFVPDFHPGRST